MIKNKMRECIKKGKYKNGLSAVVGALLLIILVVVAVGFVFAFVVPFVKNNLEDTKTCSDVIGKVELNPEFTCHSNEKFDGCWEDYPEINGLQDGCSDQRGKEAGETQWSTSNLNGTVNLTIGGCVFGERKNLTAPWTDSSLEVRALASVSIGEIELDGLVFRISAAGNTKNFIVKEGKWGEEGGYNRIANYNSDQFAVDEAHALILPKANEGRTYVFNISEISRYYNGAFSGTPPAPNACAHASKVDVAPIVNGKQCDFVDSIEFEECIKSQFSP